MAPENVLRLLVHIRDSCLRKAACRCSPAANISDWIRPLSESWAQLRSEQCAAVYCLLVAMLVAGWFDSCLVTFGDSSPTFINASNIFSRCIGGYRVPVFTSLVLAISGVEDATAVKLDTRDNLMSWVPLGLVPCFCHRLVCRSVSACSSTLGINCLDSLDSQDSPAVWWGGPWWRSAVCSTCFGSPASNFVSRTTIIRDSSCSM